MRALNMGASFAGKIGLKVGDLDQRSLLESARRQSGLDDWGGDHFIEPLERLLADFESRPITALAQASVRGVALKNLTNRLYLTEHFRAHPELNNVPIERPVFVIGFPRTGTTLLQDLLSQAPGCRALPFWELVTPVPVSEDSGRDRHLRMKDAQRKLDVTYLVAPELVEVHETRAETYEECWPLLANSFSVPNWELTSRCTSYGPWLLEQDLVPAYREYKQCLQVITARTPGKRLVLKCPDHLAALDALLEVFPDACIVWTHRDPVDCIASYCSMVSIGWRILYGRFDPKEIGPVMQDALLRWVERAMQVRAHLGEDRIFDVGFDHLVANPPEVIAQIAARFDLAQRSPAQVSADLDRVRAVEKGRHVYSVGRYGIDPVQVHERYRAYTDRFNVRVRPSSEWT